MTTYLIDTNIVSDFARNPGGRVYQRFSQVSGQRIGINSIVKGELLYGMLKNPGFRYRERLEAVLYSLEVWPMEAPIEDKYAEIRLFLSRPGREIGPNDLWIAAHAMALDAIVVTDNESEFSRVPGLKVENWLR